MDTKVGHEDEIKYEEEEEAWRKLDEYLAKVENKLDIYPYFYVPLTNSTYIK